MKTLRKKVKSLPIESARKLIPQMEKELDLEIASYQQDKSNQEAKKMVNYLKSLIKLLKERVEKSK